MSDDEPRHDLPTKGGEIFAENGSETVEDDQTGLPSWAAALTAQMQTAFAEQLAALLFHTSMTKPLIQGAIVMRTVFSVVLRLYSVDD
jgi:ABC-type uncharacterized transport system permease subunit